MIEFHFRAELDSYAMILGQWVKFTVTTSPRLVTPNGLKIERDGSLWLIHIVKEMDGPIKCKDGSAVRLLRLELGNPAEWTVH